MVQVKGKSPSYWNWDAKQMFVLRNKAKVHWQQIRAKSDKVQILKFQDYQLRFLVRRQPKGPILQGRANLVADDSINYQRGGH